MVNTGKIGAHKPEFLTDLSLSVLDPGEDILSNRSFILKTGLLTGQGGFLLINRAHGFCGRYA